MPRFQPHAHQPQFSSELRTFPASPEQLMTRTSSTSSCSPCLDHGCPICEVHDYTTARLPSSTPRTPSKTLSKNTSFPILSLVGDCLPPSPFSEHDTQPSHVSLQKSSEMTSIYDYQVTPRTDLPASRRRSSILIYHAKSPVTFSTLTSFPGVHASC